MLVILNSKTIDLLEQRQQAYFCKLEKSKKNSRKSEKSEISENNISYNSESYEEPESKSRNLRKRNKKRTKLLGVTTLDSDEEFLVKINLREVIVSCSIVTPEAKVKFDHSYFYILR